MSNTEFDLTCQCHDDAGDLTCFLGWCACTCHDDDPYGSKAWLKAHRIARPQTNLEEYES